MDYNSLALKQRLPACSFSFKRTLLRALITVLLPGGIAAAAQTNVFAAPSGYKDHAGGPAMPNANWTIWQWSAPHPFKGFYPITIGGQEMYETSAGSGWVIASTSLLAMQADGSGIACTSVQNNKSQVVEYDQQAVPPNATPLTPLSQLHHAFLTAKVAMKVGLGAGTPCPTTMTSMGDCLTLYNPTFNQVLFYQMRIGGYGYNATKKLLASFQGAAGDWFATGTNGQTGGAGQWGYDDNITMHGYGYLQSGGTTMSYNIDVLPTIKSLVATGAQKYHMDGNLADWVIISRYIGSGNWGPIKDETDWAAVALNED